MKMVSKEDMWILLSSSVRYALTRRSQAPAVVWELLRRYNDYLDDHQLQQLIDEIEVDLRLRENLNEVSCLFWKKVARLLRELLEDRRQDVGYNEISR